MAYKERVCRALACGIVVLLSASALAGCGRSGHFTPAGQAAITAVQRNDTFFRIFPDTPRTISCRIQVGGPVTGYDNGHCTTRVSTTRHRTRLDFTQRTSYGGTGVFTLILDRHNRIVVSHWHGDVPQMRN